jgi:hypothetical protein
VSDAVLKVVDAVSVAVPEFDVVVACFGGVAVNGWEVVFGDVGVVAPAA